MHTLTNYILVCSIIIPKAFPNVQSRRSERQTDSKTFWEVLNSYTNCEVPIYSHKNQHSLTLSHEIVPLSKMPCNTEESEWTYFVSVQDIKHQNPLTALAHINTITITDHIKFEASVHYCTYYEHLLHSNYADTQLTEALAKRSMHEVPCISQQTLK